MVPSLAIFLSFKEMAELRMIVADYTKSIPSFLKQRFLIIYNTYSRCTVFYVVE